MKSFLLNSVLAAIGMITISASAAHAHGEQTQSLPFDGEKIFLNLTHITLDRGPLSSGRPEGGNIIINLTKRQIALHINLGFHCPPGRMCAQVMPAPIDVELPIVSQTADTCGTRAYVAVRDERPVDGVKELIRVVDNSHNRCPHTVMMPATEVTYVVEYFDRLHGKSVHSRSTAIGTQLSPMMEIMDK